MGISVTVNNLDVEVNEGSSVLDAVNLSGTFLPQLCKDPDMNPNAACRTCLVEIDGVRGFPASCTLPAALGMKIQTDTSDLKRIRTGVIELTGL